LLERSGPPGPPLRISSCSSWLRGEEEPQRHEEHQGLNREKPKISELLEKDAAQQAAPKNSRKLLVKSYGCQMNVYDSARMSDLLEGEGYSEAAREEDADLVVLNTCHIRERASEKIYSELGRLALMKRERREAGRDLTIVVAGCVAQAEGELVLRRQSAVDLVIGPQSLQRLPQLLRRTEQGERVADTDFAVEEKFAGLPQPTRAQIAARGVSAFVTVQEGCDKFCAFCVVPYTRGAEVSRGVKEIISEARRLALSGVREITLIGQNVNAYRGEDEHGRAASLEDLFERLSAIEGLERLRYTTSHPVDMTQGLIDAHASLPKLAPFLHLPVQSGSDRVLREMNRRHDAAFYLDIVARLRRARPDIALSSDFIVGFPGETDRDFEDTLALIRAVDFASTFSFKYSPRPGTPGAEREDQIDEETKRVRLAALQALVEEQRQAFNAATLGRRLPILFEKPGRHEGQIAGKSPYMQAVHAEGDASLIGRLLEVEIVAAGANSLAGTIVSAMESA